MGVLGKVFDGALGGLGSEIGDALGGVHGGSGDNEIEPTAAENAAWEVGAKSWNTYLDLGVPAENQYMDRVDSMDAKGAYDFAGGAANTATQKAGKALRDRLVASETSKGVNANSGRFKLGLADANTATAASGGDTMSRAKVEQQDRYFGGLSNVVNIGMGQATTAQAGLGDLAEVSAAKARQDAENAFNSTQANRNMIGTGAGLAAAGYLDKSASQSGDYQPGDYDNYVTVNYE